VLDRVVRLVTLTAVSAGLVFLATSSSVAAPKANSPSAEHARIVAYWTKDRVAAAIPRDLRIDQRGLGYLRKPNGNLEPYGHSIAAMQSPRGPTPRAKPGGDTNGPAIS